MRMTPLIVTPSTRSFMRLRQRSKVDLPHPDGPMYAVIRCLGTDIETSLSACLSPYQRARCSISTMGVSSMAVVARGFRLAATCTGPAITFLLGLDGGRRVPPAEPVAHRDREQVQEDHDHQQQ